MRYFYDPQSDSLYLTIADDRTYADSVEASPGVVLDFDTSGRLMALDLEHASKTVDIADLTLQAEPTADEMVSTRLTGKRLKQNRVSLGLSQSALGGRLGVAPNTVARWERGELKIEHPEMVLLALEALRRGVDVPAPIKQRRPKARRVLRHATPAKKTRASERRVTVPGKAKGADRQRGKGK